MLAGSGHVEGRFGDGLDCLSQIVFHGIQGRGSFSNFVVARYLQIFHRQIIAGNLVSQIDGRCQRLRDQFSHQEEHDGGSGQQREKTD